MAKKLIKLLWPWQSGSSAMPQTNTAPQKPANKSAEDADFSVPPPVVTDWHRTA